MSFGILGNGEIGSSLHNVYKMAGFKDVAIRDLHQGLEANLSKCKIVNVCIPFFGYDSFVKVLHDLKLQDGCSDCFVEDCLSLSRSHVIIADSYNTCIKVIN